jgi:hypothetical protein
VSVLAKIDERSSEDQTSALAKIDAESDAGSNTENTYVIEGETVAIVLSGSDLPSRRHILSGWRSSYPAVTRSKPEVTSVIV